MLVTTCPDCDTTFKVTVAILEKAGGQVRCGRCARIFDANTRLREQPEATTERLSHATPAADEVPATGPIGSRWYLRDVPPQGGTDEPAVELTDADIAAAEGTALEGVAPEGIAVDFLVSDPDAAESASSEIERSEADLTLAAASDSAGPAETAAAAAAPRLETAAALAAEPAQPPAPGSPAADWRDEFAPTLRRRTWPWAVGAGVLILTLAAQLIHAARSDLAGAPGVGPWLISAYAMLGRELAPPVALEQYSTIDLTAAAEPVTDDLGWLIIETRVQNRGPKVQPFPHILIRLLDRWQETIAGRYFSPAEYLVTERGDYSRMDVGTTVDAQFIIVDPGANATGFELEFCTPVGDGYRCDTQ